MLFPPAHRRPFRADLGGRFSHGVPRGPTDLTHTDTGGVPGSIGRPPQCGKEPVTSCSRLQDQGASSDIVGGMTALHETNLQEPDPEPDENPDDVEFEDPLSELADRQSSPPRYEIATYPADFTLEVLKSKWDAGEIIIPPFQRGFVWSQTQASKLIESFLVGLPVPGIFLYTERSSEKSLVVDGQQRLRSVFYYMEGLFGEEHNGRRTTFRLKGLSEDSPYYGKTYAELADTDGSAVRRLKNSVLRAFVVRQLDPQDDTSVFHIFERLNTGGTLLHNQEVRNAVCTGPFNALLHELNELPSWREVLGKPKPDTRMRDVELILRFFALFHALRNYEKPIKDFMSRYMRQHANAEKDIIEHYRSEFTRTTDAVLEHLGARPFHLVAGFNSAAFDSVYCAFAGHLDSISDDVGQRWRALAASSEFQESVRSATTDVEQVRGRMALATQTLFG